MYEHHDRLGGVLQSRGVHVDYEAVLLSSEKHGEHGEGGEHRKKKLEWVA